MMEYPDEWLPYDKVPTGLRVAFETRNGTQRKGQKEQNSSRAKASPGTARLNEVEVFIFIEHEFNCLTNIGYLLLLVYLGHKTQTGATSTC